ncbi:MAG: 4Fe-4S binding protein [Oscillospiraceae bacterium]|nr:4Fe-4S binding protein [Oscillospiraceae bacterium]
MKQKTNVLQIIRNVIQLLCFLLLPGLFIDSFNGIKTAILAISGETASIANILPAIFPSVLLIIATLLFGRFFCGFMCAFGTLGDAVHFIGKKVFKLNFRMPEAVDKKMKWIKYILLALLIFTWITGIGVFAGWSPWDAFGSLLTLPPDFAYAFTSLTIGTTLLLLIVLGSLFVERFFCRYLCPMGAVFSIASLLKPAKIKKLEPVAANAGFAQIIAKWAFLFIKTTLSTRENASHA